MKVSMWELSPTSCRSWSWYSKTGKCLWQSPAHCLIYRSLIAFSVLTHETTIDWITGWPPQLLSHSSLTGHLEILCYSVDLAVRFCFLFISQFTSGVLCVNMRLKWSGSKMCMKCPGDVLCSLLVLEKYIDSKVSIWYFSWTCALRFTCSWVQLQPSQTLSASSQSFSLLASRTWDRD